MNTRTPLGERVTDPATGAILPRLLSETLRLSVTDLARVIGIKRGTLSSDVRAPRVQARLRQVVDILTATIAIHGDEARAVIFFRHHRLSRHSDKTPADLVAEGKTDLVLDYLRDLAASGR